MAFSLVFELVNICRQVQCLSARASFLLQGFLLCPILKFWRTRIAFLTFPLCIIPCDGSFLFPVFFMWCHVPLEKMTVRVDPNSSMFRRINFFGGSVYWNTQPNCLDSFKKATDRYPPFSSTFYCSAHQPQCVRIDNCRRIGIPLRDL